MKRACWFSNIKKDKDRVSFSLIPHSGTPQNAVADPLPTFDRAQVKKGEEEQGRIY